MIPSEIHELQAMPCTASGKLDLVALESYDFSCAESSASGNQENNSAVCASLDVSENVVQQIQNLWQETLSADSIAPDVSFFEQGGTSLAALSLLSSYYNLGINMTLADFYEHPTLDGQLEWIKEKLPDGTAAIVSDNASEQAVDIISASEAIPNQKDETPDISKQIQKLWRETLSADSIAPDISFFEQGGTSLAALSLLSSYYNLGINMTLADFYEHPTLNEQLVFVQMAESANTEPKQPAVIQTGTLPLTPSDDKNAVFLTGATGFLGAHLLKSLLDAGYSKVFCLVRGDCTRLEDTLEWYFGKQWLTAFRLKIEAIAGDMTQEQFGLSDESFAHICRNIAYVVHAAADVRHYACDDTPEKTNCAGTAQAISLAEKADAKLVHISTVSLCGEYLLDAPEATRDFSEQDFEIGQNWKDSIYLRGKYGAEKLVRQAMERGVSAVILRIGRLVGRSSDGVFQKNAESNAFWGLVNGMVCLDMISKDLAELPLEMTAVDDCAKAAVLLMQSEGPVYHLFNPNILTVQDILKAIGKPLSVTTDEIFEQHLKEQCRAGLGIRLAPLISQYQRLMQVPFRITPVCYDTRRELQKHHFAWTAIDPTVLLHDFLRNV